MRILLTFWLVLFLSAPLLRAEVNPSANDELAAKIVKRERAVARDLERFHPIVETYVQVMSSQHNELTLSYDRYFVSMAEFAGGLRAVRFKSRQTDILRTIGDYSDSLKPTTLQYDPSGFVAMAYPDSSTFDLKHYHFQYLNTEFLGQVRCLVFQVSPFAARKSGLFKGKIWVEDQNLTIVRFNGFYKGSNVTSKYFHFDSWRVEAKPGLWVPAGYLFSRNWAALLRSVEVQLDKDSLQGTDPVLGIWLTTPPTLAKKRETRGMVVPADSAKYPLLPFLQTR